MILGDDVGGILCDELNVHTMPTSHGELAASSIFLFASGYLARGPKKNGVGEIKERYPLLH